MSGEAMEALELAYPGAVVTRDRGILTPEQISAVAAIARVGRHGRIFPRYIARNGPPLRQKRASKADVARTVTRSAASATRKQAAIPCASAQAMPSAGPMT